MEKIKKLFAHRIFRILKWAFLVIIVLYIIAVIARVIQLRRMDDIYFQVTKIHNAKITMDDVMGTNLPPDPGAEADKTIEGIDANKNGIRDDVELAIFKEYPDSAKTRAVLLQYAFALQMETTQPSVNTIIATEVVREQSRGFECIGEIISRENSKTFDEKIDLLSEFVEIRQHNTKERSDFRKIFVKKVRSYSSLDRICDIDYYKLSS